VKPAGPGQTRIVCQPDSLKVARADIGRARLKGVTLRPSQPALPFSKADGHGRRSTSSCSSSAATTALPALRHLRPGGGVSLESLTRWSGRVISGGPGISASSRLPHTLQ
jgi:hypothetical protein